MAIGTTAALLGAAALGTAGSVASGMMQSNASGNAANAQAQAAQQGINLQRETAQQARIDSFPWAMQGAQALYQYSDALGIPRPQNPILPDLNAGPLGAAGAAGGAAGVAGGKSLPGMAGAATASPQGAQQPIPMTNALGFRETPGYGFMVQEGEKGVLNNLAALGMKNSGAALKALTTFRTGVANLTYDNYLNRLQGMAGMGQTQTNTTNALGQTAANNISNLTQAQGTARASGYMGQANAWSNALNGASNNIGGALGAMSRMPNALGSSGGTGFSLMNTGGLY